MDAACWLLAVALLGLTAMARADDEPQGGLSMRIRIAWGGGAERLWEGTIAVSEGMLSEPRPLGIEADEPGSMWLEDGRLMVRQRSCRSYDGVDVLVSAPAGAKLRVKLTAADDAQHPPQIEVPLGELSNEFRNLQLDGRDNRLLVRRTPGDQLRVSMAQKSLVFSPGERLKMEVSPHLLPVPAESKLRLKVQLVSALEQRELWVGQHDLHAGQAEDIAVEVPLPDREGVYDVVLTAMHASAWPHTVRPSLSWKRTIAERRVQVVVVDDKRSPPGRAPGELSQVVEIDPANPRWWDLKVKLPQLRGFTHLGKGPLGNGNLQSVRNSLGELAQLRPNSESPDVSWEAYTLAVNQPGRPHVLEVDYPSDASQTLGLSILEPNAAGALVPIGLDSGVEVGDELAGGPASDLAAPHWGKHRLIFWPRTSAPLLLVTNRREEQAAQYGKIRVLAGWDRLPKAFSATVAAPTSPPTTSLPPATSLPRLWAAYLDRPLFPENFSASESLDSWSGRSLDDWNTFQQGGQRLVEYLQYVGYNGLMLAVLADGSTIYPSALLEPTPRYDTGMFFGTAQDPLRKDVLEMLFRLFDREDLQLIPTLEFAAPLPAVEAVRRRGGEVEWIGPEGTSWQQNYATRRGLAPYYNILEPHVQEAVLAVVQEVAQRYAPHRAFSGLALRLSAYGYAQLPGPEWGMDDGTIGRFERDTGLQVPGEGPGRFATRAAFLTRPEHRGQWLQWRAEGLHRFYRHVREVLAAARGGTKLYLAGAEMLCGAEMEAELRPALPAKNTLLESLMHAGIDLRQYQEDPAIVLLRPQRIVPHAQLSAAAADLEINQMPDADRYFGGLPQAGSLFFHQPQEVRVASFDQRSPFKASYTWLVAQPALGGARNRQRFIHSLATMDSQLLVDGGWLLPMGQEDSLRELVAAYRQLPAVRFEPVSDGPAATPSQPVTCRFANCEGRTYVYAVNDAPFAVTARVPLLASTACQLQMLPGARRAGLLRPGVDGLVWQIELRPFDLVAATLSEPQAKLGRPQITVPAAAEALLAGRIRQLGARAAALRAPPPLKVLENAGFERPPTTADPIPGWAVSRRLGVALQIDKAVKHGGSQSARMSSDGPVACLVSRSFAPPATGRLSMSVWLRVADAAQQPPLRLALQGKHDGRDFYHFATLGQSGDPAQPAVRITSEWHPYIFQVDDLPLEGLSDLHVRFDLMGRGEVWVDDVQLFDLAFNDMEMRALYKLITLADVTLQNGQIGDCMKLLDGYWPRFLAQHVPLSAEAAAAIAARPDDGPAAAEKPAAAPPQAGLMDRMKNMLPDRLRF
jgi:hypothetical protein